MSGRRANVARHGRYCLHAGRASCQYTGSGPHPFPKFPSQRASVGALAPCCNGPSTKTVGTLTKPRTVRTEQSSSRTGSPIQSCHRTGRMSPVPNMSRAVALPLAIMQKACAGVFTSMACQFRFNTRTIALFKTSFIASSDCVFRQKTVEQLPQKRQFVQQRKRSLMFPTCDYHTHPQGHNVRPYTIELLQPWIEQCRAKGIQSIAFTDHDRYIAGVDFAVHRPPARAESRRPNPRRNRTGQ